MAEVEYPKMIYPGFGKDEMPNVGAGVVVNNLEEEEAALGNAKKPEEKQEEKKPEGWDKK